MDINALRDSDVFLYVSSLTVFESQGLTGCVT